MWPLVVAGVPVGAMYGLAALGLVAVFRTTGMLNLAQGAVATAAAFVFHQLRADAGWPAAPAAAGGLAVAAGLGLVTAAVAAGVGTGRPLAQAVASLGVAGVILAACAELFGAETVFVTPLATGVHLSVGSVVLSGHQLVVMAAAVVLAGAGAWALRSTWVGLAARGTAGERTAARLCGVPTGRLDAGSFVAGSLLAGTAGILLAPLLFLDTTGVSVFFLVKPFAAAVAAGLTSLPGALAAGVAIGVAESVLTRWGVAGLPEVVPLAVVLAALATRRGEGRLVAGLGGAQAPLATGPAARPGSGRVWPAAATAGVLAAGAGAFTPYLATVVQLGVIAALLVASHVVLAGWVGQLSFAQPAMAGVGAVMAANLAVRLGLPFPAPLLLAPLVAVPLAVVIGLPALRSRGLLLAAVTLAFSVACSAVLFRWEPFTGGVDSQTVPAPALFGFDLSGVRFTWVALAAAAVAFLAVHRLGRSRWGAAMVAVREQERAAAAVGVPVAAIKLAAFGVAGALAGLAGALATYQLQTVSVEQYHPLTAVPILALAVVAGIESLWGAALGGALYALLPEALRAVSAESLTPLVTSAALLVVLVAAPSGLVSLGRRHRAPVGGDTGTELASGSRSASEVAHSGPRPGETRPLGGCRGGRPPVLAIAGLTVRYGGLTAVDGFNLTVEAGEIVALIGPNGAGKTTVFETVSGFVAPVAGEIRLAGRPLRRLPPHRRSRFGLARTFQTGGLWGRLSVADNLAVARQWHRVRQPPLEAVLVGAGLAGWAGVRGQTLPHGLARVVEVTRALGPGPRLLLLDEPAAGLRTEEALRLLERVRAARDEHGTAVVLIEHDLRVVAAADRVVVMDEGRVIAAGLPDAVRRDPKVVAAYLGPEATAAGPMGAT